MKNATTALSPLVAFVGQPNAGKTSLFNCLTGLRCKTANYPGVTVEYSLCTMLLPDGLEARIVDSPGMRSLEGRSPDEQVAVDALFGRAGPGLPQLVVAVVDATQLARHLFLASQVRDAGFDVILAVTMTDLLDRRGLTFRPEALAESFGAPVAIVNGRTGEGADALATLISRNLPDRPDRPRAPALPRQSFEKILERYRRAEAMEKEAVVALDPASAASVVLRRADPLSEKLDRFFLSPVWGLASFFLVMAAIFTSVFWLAVPAMDAIDAAFGWAADGARQILPASWWTRLLADGLIGGAGAVAVFIPQIVILFLGMGLLEDSGYLARGAMLVDRPLAAVGLSGRAFVPLLSGFACAIPGMMAARTISNRKERLLTLFILPLMTCSARLPVYGLLIAFLTPRDRPWLGGAAMAGLYLGSLMVGLAAAALAGRFLKTGERSTLFLELPAYRRPRLRVTLKNARHSTASYLRRAGPAILWIALGLWALTHYPISPEGTDETEEIAGSWGGKLGRVLEPAMHPLGLDWRCGVAMISGFAAREVFPGTLSIMLGQGEDPAPPDAGMQSQIAMIRKAAFPDGRPIFTIASSMGLLLFFMLALQCMATVATAAKESGSRAFALTQLFGFTGAAYVASVALVQTLRWFGIA